MNIEKKARNYIKSNALSYHFNQWKRILRNVFENSYIHITKTRACNNAAIVALVECPSGELYDEWAVPTRASYYKEMENMDPDMLRTFIVILVDRSIE